MSEKNLKLANSALGLVVAYDDLMRQYTGPISDISEADNAAIDEAYDHMVFAARTTLNVVSRPSPQDQGVAGDVAAKLRLWFFRDMFESNRLALFSLFGFKAADMDTMGKQQMVFRRILAALAAQEPSQ